MMLSETRSIPPKTKAFWTGVLFLFGYWLLGFDGITFSDEVYYLLAGRSFWEGNMEVDSFHFSMRWGTYVPSGLMGLIFGFDPHRISLISLLSYLGTLALLVRILPKNSNPWVLLIWFATQVYLLHFLTKIYPDSLLVFWTLLIPFSATFRHEKPFLAALGLISGLFFGFLTKETIVFLVPLPILLFLYDWRKARPNWRFYGWLIGLGILFGAIYLGYFWIKFGDPLYRFESIQNGHYLSEYSYSDKSIAMMLKRLTFIPVISFVERTYWIWIVFAIPGLVKTRKRPESPGIEFGLAFLCLTVCFWFMSTSFRFYNPLYLNPRHLIILVPILAFLISLGWSEWTENRKLRRFIAGLILLGVAISLFQQDWKMAGFQALFLAILYWEKPAQREWILALLLLAPALASIFYQQKIKAYPEFLETLNHAVSESSSPILVNNFVHFSKEILLPEYQKAQEQLLPIEKLDSLKIHLPVEFRVLVYDYYQHAYPKEQEDLDRLEQWLEKECTLLDEKQEGKVRIQLFKRN
jgi:hypothetical protein